MTAEVLPHRLSAIGYWSSADESPGQSHGLPDPHDLVTAWDEADLRTCLSRLRGGKVFREFSRSSTGVISPLNSNSIGGVPEGNRAPV